MESLWKWLLRANARTVFLGAVVGLCAVTMGWAYREMFPSAYAFDLSARRHAPVNRESIGLLTFLERQLSSEFSVVPRSPFFSYDPPAVRPDPKRTAVKPPPETPAAPAVPEKSPGGEPTPAAAVPAGRTAPRPRAPDKPPLVATYRGMLKRPDGKTLALIYDSLSGKTRFHNVDDGMFGLRVRNIGPGGLEVTGPHDTAIRMMLGKPVELPGASHE